jgi:hypothetical protein
MENNAMQILDHGHRTAGWGSRTPGTIADMLISAAAPVFCPNHSNTPRKDLVLAAQIFVNCAIAGYQLV